MALNLGTLTADITADTSGLRAAEQEAARTTIKINKSLKITGLAAKRVSGEFVRMNSAVKGVAKPFKDTGKAANDAGKKVKGFGRNAGQAGIQFQQMVGQLQGGVSPFVAVSQQAADLGFVLGAPLVGVIVSLAAVLAGVLHAALTGSAESMERAKTSAADLNAEYSKLTGQTKALAAAKLSTSMLEDAGAIVILGEELSTLKKRRDLVLSRQRGPQNRGKSDVVITLDKEIFDIQNRFDTLVALNAKRQEELGKFIAGERGELSQTEGPGGATGGAVSGGTFNQLVQKEIASLELRGKLFNDSNAKIEAEIMRFELAALNLFEVGSEDFLAAEQALADKRVELRETADKKILDQQTADQNKQLQAQTAARNAALSGLANFGTQANALITAAGAEGTLAAKAVFLAMKAIQVAQILAATEVAAAQAGAVAAIGGPLPFFATQAAIRATGFASAGIVAGLAVGESFEDGGIVPGSSFSGDRVPARVNSGEMILNKGQQSNLFSLANGGGGGGSQNISIISNGTPQTVSGAEVSRREIKIMINDASRGTEKKINTSLATGRGDTFNSLRRGSKIERNLT